jgi:hypothetical protein
MWLETKVLILHHLQSNLVDTRQAYGAQIVAKVDILRSFVELKHLKDNEALITVNLNHHLNTIEIGVKIIERAVTRVVCKVMEVQVGQGMSFTNFVEDGIQ